MPNRLAGETSPYLLQHANNPVNWFPWGDEALTKARAENKVIFLSVGYSACHWCHVMEHESFEDVETARMLNDYFVSIKVDREERPDIDSIYMGAVMAMTGSGGWPMSVFLTPEGRPFYGGTYFPPTRRYGMPSFKEVLNSIIRSWAEAKGEIYRVADKLTNHLQETSAWAARSGSDVTAATLKGAARELIHSFDRKHGGWGSAPLFPHPMAIEFLLLQATRGDTAAGETALAALKTMNSGGLYDVVGGGFHRYSTDDQWLVPHFEKMLYDNGQLALTYLHGYLISRDESLLHTCLDTLDFIQRELADPSGGFYSSLDADSEGEEGKFYTWDADEILSILGDSLDFEFLKQAYAMPSRGNFEGKLILQRRMDDDELARDQGISPGEARARLEMLHQKLYQARARRVRPATDDKVLVSWNALALQAFAEAARYLERQDYLEIARKNAAFLLDNLYRDGHLLRAWRKDQARHEAFLEDHASLIIALLALYQTDSDPRWFEAARHLGEDLLAGFSDTQGGFFTTRAGQPGLIHRPKEMQDNATPSGNSLAAYALLLLSEYTGRGDLRDLAEPLLAGVQDVAVQYPVAFGYWLQAMDFAVGPVRQVAILAPQASTRSDELQQAVWEDFRPRLILAAAAYPPGDNEPELLRERPLRENSATAYVCQGFACQQPTTDPQVLKEQLKEV